MMNFKNIEKYSNYQSYQRIKRIKHQQCNRGLTKSRCKHTSYQDCLDRKDGLVCCLIDNKKVNCMYTGILGKTPCLTATLHAVLFDIRESPNARDSHGVIHVVGFDDQGHGSLLPDISWYGSTVVSFIYTDGQWGIQFKGKTKPVFHCIELTQNNKTIRLFVHPTDDKNNSLPKEEATYNFDWLKAEPGGASLTAGAWVFRFCVRC